MARSLSCYQINSIQYSLAFLENNQEQLDRQPVSSSIIRQSSVIEPIRNSVIEYRRRQKKMKSNQIFPRQPKKKERRTRSLRTCLSSWSADPSARSSQQIAFPAFQTPPPQKKLGTKLGKEITKPPPLKKKPHLFYRRVARVTNRSLREKSGKLGLKKK